MDDDLHPVVKVIAAVTAMLSAIRGMVLPVPESTSRTIGPPALR